MTIDPVSLAITAALTAAQMGLQATRKIEGPRLEDLKVTVADYGTPLNYFYGTRRFEGVPIIWAEPIRERKRRRKTKGGKYNDYTYYGTWAVAVADHEIDAVTRIWFDKHLVYDATGAGPVTPFVLGGRFNLNDSLRIYLGTETQEADPRMLASVEAEHGAGSCPAYRGVSYLVFEEIPLEKVGNRIPQITVEAMANGQAAYPYETFNVATVQPARMHGFTFSPDFTRMMWGGDDYEIWDVASRSLMISGAFNPAIGGVKDVFGISSNGTIYSISSAGGVTAYNPDGLGAGTLLIDTTSNPTSNLRVLRDGLGREHIFTIPFSFNQNWYSYEIGGLTGAVLHVPFDEVGEGFSPGAYFTDSYGDIWLVGRLIGPFVNADTLILQRVVDTGARPGSDGLGIISMPPGGNAAEVAGCHYSAEAHFVIRWNGELYLIDDTTFTIKDSAAIGYDVYSDVKQFANLPAGSSSIWLNTSEISLADLSVIRTIDLLDWKNEDADGIMYDPLNHALICAPQFDAVLTWRYLDRVGSQAVTLQSIVEDVADRCGIDPVNVDAADLDQTVIGYSWTQGAGKDILEPLLDAFDSIVRPHDFTMQFNKLGDSSGGTIDVAQFVRNGNEPPYKITITLDTDLPRGMTFSFADVDADQQTNAVRVQRPLDVVDGVRELSVDMTTLALDVDTARQMAERWFRRRWFGREVYELGLTAQYLALESGDVRTLSFDGSTRVARIREANHDADGVITTLWERDDPSIALLSGSAGAGFDGRTPSVISVSGVSKGLVIDAPLAIDADDQTTPFVYLGAAPYDDGALWPGCDFWHSDDGTIDSYEPAWAAIAAGNEMSWGYANSALGTAVPHNFDTGNSLSVIMRSGTLTSVTRDELLEDSALNLLLIGADGRWEYVQFQTATLEIDGSYTLSGLIRGARGTEHAISEHVLGDSVVVISTARNKQTMGASEIGDSDYYKAVTQGRDESSAFAQSVAFGAAAQKPYSPVHGSLTLDAGTGDWSIDATRRTRIGGANVDGQDVPLGESAESWSCDIMDGSTVKRTLTGSSLPLTYTSAQQTTDWGAPQSDLSVNLYQVSPALSLRGYPLALAA